jgi:hypothetical protein
MAYDRDRRREKEQQTIDSAQAKLIANPHLRGYLEGRPHPHDLRGGRHTKEWNELHYCEFVFENGSHSKKLEVARDILKLPVANYKK